MQKQKSQPIATDQFLTEEYEYIAQTAAQANEDRARVSSFYLIAVGSLIAAIFGTQFFDADFFTRGVKFIFSGIFLLLTLMGTSTIVQLARLRAAWHESMLAMNQLKEFMISQNKDISKAFRWTSRTLPPKYKKASISFYQAREAAILSGVTFTASVYFAEYALGMNSWVNWLIAAACGIVVIFLQIVIYKRALN
ncbi:MAG TPA: hypothetical protein PLA27_01130 [Anaerolineales bacterium]|jgi:hypothetical protein|nr:hypothetical protein [Anaerolineales bacterium]HQX14993.1 hypothetical protein [Anaerolineales bacterium]